MDPPSDEAVQIYMEYFQENTNTCRFLPFLKHMLYFLVDDFDFKIDADALPTAAIEETISEEKVRVQVVDRLLDEFKDNFDDPLGEPFRMEEEGFGEYAYVKAVDLFYFCLNRKQRKPSNSNQSTFVKTAKEQRDEDWRVHIEDLHRQAKCAIRKSMCRGRQAYQLKRVGRKSSIEAARGSESDDCFLAADKVESRPDRPLQRTELVLERKSNGFDIPIEAKLPRPLKLTPLCRRDCAKHLLLRVSELHFERYHEVLEQHPTLEIYANLESNLTPGVRLVSDRGIFSLNGLRSIGGDIKASAAGIYLHIIWYPNDPQTFWLYVGQARHLGNRISDHNDRVYRRKHPSLHYHVWDSQEDMCSEFVILAIFQNEAAERNLSKYEQCLLNLLEMWMACLFRTLTAKDLDTYLPPSVDRTTAGRHLNVVPPIAQRFHDEDSPARKDVFDRAGFEELLRSADPAVRLWARHATASYNDLRNSPDPRLRCYWFANNRRQLRQAWVANEKHAIDDMKVYQIEGKEVTGCCSRGRDRAYILCGKFNFPLPQSLEISPGSKVFVQFHLYEIAVSHRYASQAIPFDPASRLAISIKGCNNSGTEVDRWIQSPGKKVPMKINALVDMLEGVALTETRALSRRWTVIRPEEGSPQKTYYTSM